MCSNTLPVGTSVSVLLTRRTSDTASIYVQGVVEAVDTQVLLLRGRRLAPKSSSAFSEDEQPRDLRPLDDAPRLFAIPFASMRLVQVLDREERAQSA